MPRAKGAGGVATTGNRREDDPSRTSRLSELLGARRDALLTAWRRRVLAAYPEETQKFLTDKKDPFSNPVGAALDEGTADILAYLIEDGDREELAAKLQHLVRIRAVQQFTPAQAIGFVFQLKDVARRELGDSVAREALFEDQLAFESRIDDVTMVCMELYAAAREQLFQSQLKSVHRQSYKLVERMNRMMRIPGEPEDGAEENE